MHDAQTVIASIFEPGNRTLASAPVSSPSEKSTLSQEKDLTSSLGASPSNNPTSSIWQGVTRRVGAWLPTTSPPSQDSSHVAAPSSPTTAAAAAATTWDQLPPSPLAGYELTKRGLVDRLRTPPHTLNAAELKDLIRELTAVEQNAKYDVDKHFAGHLGSRGLHGLELLVNPCLFLAGLYLMTWKTVQLYSGAVPQDSVVFTKLLSLMQRRMPAGQRELLAQRHRRLMRATNARVALTFLTGVSLSALAWVSRPSRNVMEDAPDMQLARDMVAYQRHAEASVKWCWYIYYHHPTYRSSTNV